MRLLVLALCCAAAVTSALHTVATVKASKPASCLMSPVETPLGRRSLLYGAVAAAAALLADRSAASAFSVDEGKAAPPANPALDELPPKAKTAYLQYLPQLQLAADFYVFELFPLLATPGRWDSIGALTESTNIGSAASVSRLEREFITPMRILALSFPPDAGGDDMQSALDGFQKDMFRLSSQARKGATTGNVAQPSQVEVDNIRVTWESGRSNLNTFFEALNEGTQSKRLVYIPQNGVGYARSKSLYVQLQKDAAICRNRGGEALAGLWGQLMVYGTVPGVNPCGDAAGAYFSQGM